MPSDKCSRQGTAFSGESNHLLQPLPSANKLPDGRKPGLMRNAVKCGGQNGFVAFLHLHVMTLPVPPRFVFSHTDQLEAVGPQNASDVVGLKCG